MPVLRRVRSSLTTMTNLAKLYHSWRILDAFLRVLLHHTASQRLQQLQVLSTRIEHFIITTYATHSAALQDFYPRSRTNLFLRNPVSTIQIAFEFARYYVHNVTLYNQEELCKNRLKHRRLLSFYTFSWLTQDIFVLGDVLSLFLWFFVSIRWTACAKSAMGIDWVARRFI